MKTLATLTIASLFSLTANAGNFSNLDYESYAESSVWPSNTSSSVNAVAVEDLSKFDYETYADSSSFPSPTLNSTSALSSIADIQSSIEQSPTAAGSSSHTDDVLLRDLGGEDIHAQ